MDGLASRVVETRHNSLRRRVLWPISGSARIAGAARGALEIQTASLGAGDMNTDGAADGLDIELFMDILSQ